MAEPRWIPAFLFLILQLQVTGSCNELSVLKRVGDEVLLSCQNIEGSQQSRKSTTWIFTASRAAAPVELVKLGEIGEHSRNKPRRLRVTAAGSLVIRKVAVEDAGRYECLQNKSGNEQKKSAQVDLSVIHCIKKESERMMTFSCTVLTFDTCKYKLEWEFNPTDVLTIIQQSHCYITMDYFMHLAESSWIKCKVTFEDVLLFISNSESQAKAETTEDIKSGPMTESCDHRETYQIIKIIIISVGLAGLSVTVLVVHIWTRIKGNKTRMNKIKVQRGDDDEC